MIEAVQKTEVAWRIFDSDNLERGGRLVVCKASASTAEDAIAIYEGSRDFIPDVRETRIAGIKAEAGSRIVAICPEWKQRNLSAQAIMLIAKGAENWTAEDRAAWDAGEAVWDRIKAIRTASDVLELDPPEDFSDDRHWPVRV